MCGEHHVWKWVEKVLEGGVTLIAGLQNYQSFYSTIVRALSVTIPVTPLVPTGAVWTFYNEHIFFSINLEVTI